MEDYEEALKCLFEAWNVHEIDQVVVRYALQKRIIKQYPVIIFFGCIPTDLCCYVTKISNTRFCFHGILPLLRRLHNTDVIYVELDPLRNQTLESMVKRNHKSRFDYFEFEKHSNCIIAYD